MKSFKARRRALASPAGKGVARNENVKALLHLKLRLIQTDERRCHFIRDSRTAQNDLIGVDVFCGTTVTRDEIFMRFSELPIRDAASTALAAQSSRCEQCASPFPGVLQNFDCWCHGGTGRNGIAVHRDTCCIWFHATRRLHL